VEIDDAYVNWANVTELAKAYDIHDTATIRRHARATGLTEKRDRNVRHALGKIIEHASTVIPNSAAIVQACVALAKITSDGRYVERRETLNLTPVFERMSAAELEQYAQSGVLPEWSDAVKVGK
jgi:hypothetical protein